MRKLLISLSIVVVLLLVFASTVWATHNRAGEITYKSAPLPGDPYRYEFTIITYTKTGGESETADRDSLDVDFGDGSDILKIPRINGSGAKGEVIPGTFIKYNEYFWVHSYTAPFDYTVSMQDPNRIGNIRNMSNSLDVPFYLECLVKVRNPQFLGYNSSPILYQPPIDYGNINYPFIHNPNAFDPDGDSLYFELIAPMADRDVNVPFYQLPDDFPPGPANNISLNPFTGEFIWDSPQEEGIYNIAFLITEYRNGLEIGSTVRDMQIIVEESKNRPPDVEVVRDTCVEIGQTLVIDAMATDPDRGQLITISAFGGPLETESSPAIFQIEQSPDTVNSSFIWGTTCDHIYSEEYTVVIKAEDNFRKNGDPLPLSDLETWQITLTPPAPEDLSATIEEGEIVLTWNTNANYICEGNDKFMGYSIWRTIGCDSLELDECKQGLGGTSYVRIAEGEMGNTFIDENASKGIVYSYRIIAEFADAFTGSNPPTPLNVVASVASLNTCLELPKDAPIIINASVEKTDLNNGEVYVAWTKPVAEALDTVVNKPPYRYELYRQERGGVFELLDSWEYNLLSEANDTIYTDTNIPLNTQDKDYSYKVVFYSDGIVVDETSTAQTVFLNIAPIDNALELTWEVVVPWINTAYHIYRQNTQGVFDSVGVAYSTSFVDDSLANGQEYCYYIKAVGTYSSVGLPDPLINLSQIKCSEPIDTIPPCPPILSVRNSCDSDLVEGEIEYSNRLSWSNPNNSCANDVIGYNVYYSAPLNPNFDLLATINSAVDTYYEHLLESSLAGCYKVSAVDSFANESTFSNAECKENCLAYELPNTFTPNGDNMNDVFIPRKSLFVSSVNMKIFNRWGGLVFETSDPLIEWNGKQNNVGEDLAEGVYYYVCDVLEQSSDGIETIGESLNGYIHLIRGKK